jgi:hypothetical protein
MTVETGASSMRRAFDRARLAQAAEWLAVAVAASLPWSTTATGILIALWLLALVPGLDLAALVRSESRAASVLPLMLAGLAVAGMLWSVAPFHEQYDLLKSFAKLLVIPLLLFQFSRCDRGTAVILAFLVSCTVLMIASWINRYYPNLPWRSSAAGVPVKDSIVQSGEFLLCAFALVHLALDRWLARERARAAALAGWALAFFANIVFVVTSRTTVVMFFVLIALFAAQRLSRRGAVAALLAGCILAASAAALSPYLRTRVLNVVQEIQQYVQHDAATSSGYRLEFWKRSVDIVVQAPIVGHGTGSTAEMFRRSAAGQSGMAALVTNNPHNQTLNVAIQLGLVGVAVLYAMWLAHALLFVRAGFAAWIGLAVVLQNVVSSVSNSQLFFFAPGWLYVFGVGVLGGMVSRALQEDRLTHPPSAPQ